MVKEIDISAFLESWAPLSTQEEWDRSGFQIHFNHCDISSVTIAMDLTPRVIEEAIANKSQMILTHHPFFFQGIYSIDDNDIKSKMVIDLLREKINVFSSHTNLDKAKNGVNEQWAEMLNLNNFEVLDEDDQIGVVGQLNISLKDLLKRFKELGIEYVRGYGKKKENFSRIAIVGGSGSDYIQSAVSKGADLLITGDMSHHKGQEAFESELMVIDISHFESEKFILTRLAEYIKEEFPSLDIYISEKCDFVFDLF